MKSIVPYKNTFGLADRTFEDFYKTMEDFFQDKWFGEKTSLAGTFKLDIQEKDREYVVEAELPGFKKEEISVELTNETLFISAEKEEKIDEEKKNYIHNERKYESVKRGIFLKGSMTDGITAKLDNGVLTIAIPKEKKEEPVSKITIE